MAGCALNAATWLHGVLATFLAALTAAPQTNSPLLLQRTIALPSVTGRIDHMAFDPKSDRLFVAALGNNTVEIVDVEKGAVLHTIRGLHEPQGVLFLADVNRLYIANGDDGTVQMYNGSNYQLIKTVPLGKDADNIRFDPTRRLVYVGYGSGGLSVLQEDGSKVGDIQLGAHPESFQLERNGQRIFVNLPGAHKVAVVDRTTNTVVSQWGLGLALANFPMALDEPDHRLFIDCRVPAHLLGFDTETGKVVNKAPVVGDSDDVFYDAKHKRIYGTGGEGKISVFDRLAAGTLKELAAVETRKGARTSLLSPDGSYFFVAAREENGQPASVYVYLVQQ